MTLKSLATKTTAAAICATVALVGAPAEAMTLVGSVTLNAVDEDLKIDANSIEFGEGLINAATGDFASLLTSPRTILPDGNIQDISGLSVGTNSIGPINSFINFGIVSLGSSSPNTLLFNLLSATVTTTPTGSNGVLHTATDVVGEFSYGGETVARGLVTAQDLGTSGWTISLEAEPIPTPALLPGLIGMGVVALRKKQGEESEQEA